MPEATTKPENWNDEYIWEKADDKTVNLAKVSKKDWGLPDEIRRMDSAELIEKGAAIIAEAYSRTGLFRSIAEIICSLRLKYQAKDGCRDLMGRTGPYRKAANEMYKRAGVPTGLDQGMQQAIRHHVRKLIWLEATPKEKELLKLTDPFKPAADTSRTSTTTPNGNEGEDGEGDEETVSDGAGAVTEVEADGAASAMYPTNFMQRVLPALIRIQTDITTRGVLKDEDREQFKAQLEQAVELINAMYEFLDTPQTPEAREASEEEALAS